MRYTVIQKSRGTVMQNKTCLITGANSGIGKEIALGLAQQGAHLILVCRNVSKAQLVVNEIKEKTGSEKIDLLIVDLSSQAEIRSLANTILNRYSRLDVLINNAGLVLLNKKHSVDNIEMTLATNHLGPFLLNYLLIDLLKASAPSRIINVSSASHHWAKLAMDDLQFEHRKYKLMAAYAQSKLLMNIVSFELARRLEGTGVTVNCVHPGIVRSHLGSDEANNLFLKTFDKLIKCFFISPKAGAKTPLYLASSPEVQNVTGKYFVKYKPRAAKAIAYDQDLAKKIWQISENLVGIKD